MFTTTQRLMRSRDERIIAGVAGGIAQYMAIDPVIVRLAFIALIFTGVGVLLYPVLWLIMPQAGARQPEPEQAFGEMQNEARRVEKEVREVFTQYAPRYDPMTGAPVDPEVEVPINNIGDSAAPQARAGRQRELGILLLGFGAMLLLSMMVGPMFGKILFPVLLIGAGAMLLRRQQ